MCAIIGFKGRNSAPQIIHKGLQQMEYRGYDSWGIAVSGTNGLEVQKAVGVVSELHLETTDSSLGIGHTRWATHGGVTETNAHPHVSTDKTFALVQNGIVENFAELKTELEKDGFSFISQTDTEVIVRLIEKNLKETPDLLDAIRHTSLMLTGRNTFAVIDYKSDRIIAFKNGSPLVVGKDNAENTFIIASDLYAFDGKVDNYAIVENFTVVVIDSKGIHAMNQQGEELKLKYETIDKKIYEQQKTIEGHHMLAEIFEQPKSITHAIDRNEEDLLAFAAVLKKADSCFITGAGTAFFAAAQIAYYLRSIAGIKAIEIKSHEVSSYESLITKNSVLFAISQSGETADTIEAIEIFKEKSAQIAALVNMEGSTMSRLADFNFKLKAGPEKAVASTKAFTAQVSFGYLLAQTMQDQFTTAQNEIDKLVKTLDEELKSDLPIHIQKLAKELVSKEHLFILGKGENYITALEAALKMKEITYKHFEGFSAGELKHGVIALIEEGVPVFIIENDPESSTDMMSAAAEVKARGAMTIGITTSQNNQFDRSIIVPESSHLSGILNIAVFQLLSYYLALALGLNPDRPRNLAKSVTVK